MSVCEEIVRSREGDVKVDETDSFWTREYEIGRPVGIREEQRTCLKLLKNVVRPVRSKRRIRGGANDGDNL